MIPTTITGTDINLTFTNNTLETGTPSPAAANIIVNKEVATVTLDSPGSNYNSGAPSEGGQLP